MLTALRMALRNLWQGGRRTALLMTALALVTLLLVLLDALAAGLEASMLRSATTLSSGDLNVGGFFKQTSGQATPVVAEGARVRQIVEQEVPDVDFVIDRVRGFARVVSDNASLWGALSGVDIDEEQRLRSVLQITEGTVDDLRKPDTVLIFTGHAKRLEVKVGDMLTMSAPTMGGVSNTVDVRVVAIARDVGFLSAWNLFMPKETVRRLYQMRSDATGAVQVYLKDPEQAGAVVEALRPKLEAAGFLLLAHDPRPFWMKFETVAGQDWVNQKLDVTTWQDEVSFLMWMLTGFATIRYFLLGLMLLVIVVGIMNTLYMAIRERTREIGTMRAIGLSRGGVMRLFLLEAAALGSGAAVIGGGLGALIALAINAAEFHVPSDAMQMILMTDRLYLALTPMNVLQAILVITAVTCLAAIAPAWRAARMRPIGALHQVG